MAGAYRACGQRGAGGEGDPSAHREQAAIFKSEVTSAAVTRLTGAHEDGGEGWRWAGAGAGGVWMAQQNGLSEGRSEVSREVRVSERE